MAKRNYYRLNTNWTTNPPYEYGVDLQREKVVFSFNETSNISLKNNDVVLLVKGTSVYAIAVVIGKQDNTDFELGNGEEYIGDIYDVEWIDVTSLSLTVCRPTSNITASANGYTIVRDGTVDEIINEYKSKKMITDILSLAGTNKNLILTGAPGTGKTFTAKDVAEQMIFKTVSSDKKEQAEKLKTSPQFKLVQFHPAYTYEDFVRGVVVETTSGTPTYKTVNKTLGEFAKRAAEDVDKKPYVLIIDEINRANLPAVLGELIYALEYRGETVESMYKLDDGNNSLMLPENLFIIGTMNTADRSVGQIDYAIRRRFAFVECLPKDLSNSLPTGKTFESDLFKQVSALFIKNVNTYEADSKLEKSDYLSAEFRPEDVWIGHSYFITDDKKTKDYRLKYEIKPILKEYLKDGILTSAAEDKINELK